MSLDVSGFPAFFRALHGYEPFPWQTMLAERVLDEGWPEGIDLPTASGKTACLDIAIFALACLAPPDPRTPRRVFFVVDRRIIVDAAYERAWKIAKRLREADDGILQVAAESLRQIAGGSSTNPLVVSRLRGGTLRDLTWRRSPIQPTIVTGTVDQVGSRILFRGFGATDLTAPIDAALTACDSLVLLDEAHCAVPFLQTARSVCRYAGPPWSENPVAPPLSFTILSATLPAEVRDVFPADREKSLNHAELRRRVETPKPASLRLARAPNARRWTLGGDRSSEDPLVLDAAQTAAEYVADGVSRIAVMVNRVATAERIHHQLLKGLDRDAADVVLMTGRMRPIDRDDLTERWSPCLRADGPVTHDRPIVLVTTQCLEVGADFSFDALVTECASLDALRQRFGRVNRLGRGEPVESCVLVRKEQTGKKYNDPIYGLAIGASWEWLRENADETFDFGIAAVDEALPADQKARRELLGELNAPTLDAPVMLPAHVDAWSRTSPRPEPEPDIGVFLHGRERFVPEARIVWRGDLGEPGRWVDVVGLLPPLSAESLTVPLRVLRRWLRGNRIERADIADVEGGGALEIESKRSRDRQRFLLWRGRDRSQETEDPSLIVPDDVVVVPADEDRALDLSSWFQRPEGRLLDVAEEASWVGRHCRILRVHPDVLKPHSRSEPVRELLGWAKEEGSPFEELQPLLTAVASHEPEEEEPDLPGWFVRAAAELANRARVRRYPDTWEAVILESPTARIPHEDGTYSDADDLTSEGPSLSLDAHLSDVGRMAREFSQNSLESDLAELVRQAGQLHDLGKVDERFQVLLCGGELAAAAAEAPLAKSGGVPRTFRQRSRLRRISGLPTGFRHEMLSARLVEEMGLEELNPADRELLIHLVEAHHGYARPFAPVVSDQTPPAVRYEAANGSLRVELGASERSDGRSHELGSGVGDRFFSAQERFGWWGLAYLEAILRLADWAASSSPTESPLDADRATVMAEA